MLIELGALGGVLIWGHAALRTDNIPGEDVARVFIGGPLLGAAWGAAFGAVIFLISMLIRAGLAAVAA